MQPATMERIGGISSIGVKTPHATFMAVSAVFSIATRGDTVDLTVFTRDRMPPREKRAMPGDVVSMSGNEYLLDIVRVEAGQTARSIAGGVPTVRRARDAKERPR